MRRLAALACAAALGGCSLEPAYVRPDPAIPPSWPTGPAYAANQQGLPSLSYRQLFRDPHLLAVIDRALADNQDLAAAIANVQIARAQYKVERAARLPRIDATAAAQRQRARGPAGEAQTSSTYDLDVGLSSFEIDLFGRLKSLSDAARQQYFASQAGAAEARLTLVAEVASAYLTYASDRSLLAIAADTEAAAAKSVELTRARLTGGIAPRTDLRQAETVLDQARSDRAELTTTVAQDRNALELLVGAPVADADLPADLAAVDTLVGELPAGLDSHVLLRRPDVAEAEYRLRAANAQIGAARAAFFPTISLTAAAGFASPALGSLFQGRNFTWSARPQASLPIFDGGANRANLALSKAERELMLADYQKAIQTAFREVADALARRGTIDDQLAAQAALEAAARDELALADARYRGGIDPYLTQLEAQRTFYGAQRSLIATRLTKVENLVTLYRTLGGDQQIDMAPPPGLRVGAQTRQP